MDQLGSTSNAALIGSVLLLLSMLWVRHRANASTRARHDDEALDTVQAWPPQAVRVLTLPERQAYELLRRALPQHLILAQVPLQRFISVPPKHRYGEWLQRVGRQTVDILVCDASSRVLAAVEVRSSSETERSRARHARMAQVLKAAGLAVHVWNEAKLPSPTEVRQLFKRKDEPEFDVLGPNGRLPVADMQELLAEGDAVDYGAGQEPVPSGFFDDLEAAHSSRSARV
jgi:hypothetical protein